MGDRPLRGIGSANQQSNSGEGNGDARLFSISGWRDNAFPRRTGFKASISASSAVVPEGQVEKENEIESGASGARVKEVAGSKGVASSSNGLWKVVPPSTTVLAGGKGGGGPRRVPVDSAEAPPIGFGRGRRV